MASVPTIKFNAYYFYAPKGIAKLEFLEVFRSYKEGVRGVNLNVCKMRIRIVSKKFNRSRGQEFEIKTVKPFWSEFILSNRKWEHTKACTKAYCTIVKKW